MPPKFNRVPITCEYNCCGCGTGFYADYPGPVQCPKCASKYAQWVNYRLVADRLAPPRREAAGA